MIMKISGRSFTFQNEGGKQILHYFVWKVSSASLLSHSFIRCNLYRSSCHSVSVHLDTERFVHSCCFLLLFLQSYATFFVQLHQISPNCSYPFSITFFIFFSNSVARNLSEINWSKILCFVVLCKVASFQAGLLLWTSCEELLVVV